MNARVFLLVLVTGFFMAAWNSDQNAMQAALARRDQARATRVAMLEATSRADSSSASIHDADSNPNAEAASDSPSDESIQHGIPLPSGIVPGHYQAVNQAGVIQKIEVHKTESSQQAGPRDFYISDDAAGNRWYLVRIQTQN
ncbi:MAG: hypothetical protein JNL58_12070 [Planctomyces sp.]|nr:hypothetical protein [Planctomyces sp.]